MKVLWNDKIVEGSDVRINIEDRGYQYGDGLYEVIRVYGGEMFMAQEHLDRLWVGAKKIHLALPFTKEELLERLRQLIAAENLQEAKVYLQVTHGIGAPRNHAMPDPEKVQPILTANVQSHERPVNKQEKGIKAALIEDMRWLHCDIKSISLLGNVLALDEAKRKGFDDAIQVRDGAVTEASAANCWIIKDNIVYTHPDGRFVLPGITKLQVLRLAKAMNLEVREEPFSVEDLLAADECFITSTTAEIVPVVQVEEHQIGSGKRGPVTQKIQEAYIASTEKKG